MLALLKTKSIFGRRGTLIATLWTKMQDFLIGPSRYELVVGEGDVNGKPSTSLIAHL